MTDARIENMLDECLDAVLVRGESVEKACSRFTGYEAELKSLTGLALQGREALAVTVPVETIYTTKARVMAEVDAAARRRALEQDAVSVRSRRGCFGLKPLAWITGAFVILTSGTALAASGAGPDSFLYPVKQRLEEAGTALSWQNLDKAQSEIGHASERLDEIEEMVAAGKPELVPDLIYRYELHLDAAIGYANRAAADGDDAGEVYLMIDELKARFDKLMEETSAGRSDEELSKLFGSGGSGIGTTGRQGRSGSDAYGEPEDGSAGDSDSDDYYGGGGSGGGDSPTEDSHPDSGSADGEYPDEHAESEHSDSDKSEHPDVESHSHSEGHPDSDLE